MCFHGDHTCRTRSPALGTCRSLMSETQSRPTTHTPLPTWAFWASVLGISTGCPGPPALHSPGHVLSPRANSSLRREGQPTEILRPLPACPVPRAFSAVPRVGGPTSGYSLSPVGHHVPSSALMDIASQFSLLCFINFSFLPDHPVGGPCCHYSTFKPTLSAFPSHPGWSSRVQIHPSS